MFSSGHQFINESGAFHASAPGESTTGSKDTIGDNNNGNVDDDEDVL